ncbi:hypothetical protein PT2222_160105 [Paraburkholderia tropica]
MTIRRTNRFDARERGHQHQQRRFRQVEVRHEPVHHAELIARRDEDVGFGLGGRERAAFALGVARGGFERAHRGGAHGDHAATARARGGDLVDERLRQLIPLAVHRVIGDVFHAHRLERARADVQRERCALHALGVELREQRVVEVQARRGRGHRARILREHGLVAGFVAGVGVVRDVWRQRQTAELLDQREAVVGEVQRVERLDALAHRHVEGVGQTQRGAGRRALARADLRERRARAGQALDEHLDLAAAGLLAEETRLQHLGIVEHQQIAGRDARGQIRDGAVGQPGGLDGIVHFQKAARAALGQGDLRDQCFGKIEIEIGKLEHAA